MTVIGRREIARLQTMVNGLDEAFTTGVVPGTLPDLTVRLRAALTELARLEARAHTPELDDFAHGVILEAQHQRDRWGTAHDADKTPEDWFWTLGYLGGKALHAATSGDEKKLLHHTITCAALLANWHAQVRAAAGAPPTTTVSEGEATATIYLPCGHAGPTGWCWPCVSDEVRRQREDFVDELAIARTTLECIAANDTAEEDGQPVVRPNLSGEAAQSAAQHALLATRGFTALPRPPIPEAGRFQVLLRRVFEAFRDTDGDTWGEWEQETPELQACFRAAAIAAIQAYREIGGEPGRPVCKACGRPDGFDFHVQDPTWALAVPEDLRSGVVCLTCFDRFAAERHVPYVVSRLFFAGVELVHEFEAVNVGSREPA